MVKRHLWHTQRTLTPSSRDCLRIWSLCKQAVPSWCVQALLEQGYTVIDGVFNAATCQTFRNEILSLRDQSLLHLNSTHLVKGSSTRLLPKHGIYEAEVADKVRPTRDVLTTH